MMTVAPRQRVVLLSCAVGLAAAVALSVAATPPAHEGLSIGARLFSDKRLSVDGTVSCASCHLPEKAFSDGRTVAIGVGGLTGARNTPSLTTASLHRVFSWEGRHTTLESQVLAPLRNAREHGFASDEQIVAALSKATDYPQLFRASLSIEAIAKELAQYVVTLSASDSRFDRYWFGKEKTAFGEPERRGLEFFRGPAGCTACHKLDETSAPFTDDKFHALGAIPAALKQSLASSAMRAANASQAELQELITSDPAVAALGRFNVTKRPADIGRYRTPSLRNVAVTAPYMHDGSVATLEEAVELEIYYRGIEQGRPLLLSPAERRDLVAFLRALTSETYEQAQGRQ